MIGPFFQKQHVKNRMMTLKDHYSECYDILHKWNGIGWLESYDTNVWGQIKGLVWDFKGTYYYIIFTIVMCLLCKTIYTIRTLSVNKIQFCIDKNILQTDNMFLLQMYQYQQITFVGKNF